MVASERVAEFVPPVLGRALPCIANARTVSCEARAEANMPLVRVPRACTNARPMFLRLAANMPLQAGLRAFPATMPVVPEHVGGGGSGHMRGSSGMVAVVRAMFKGPSVVASAGPRATGQSVDMND